MSDVFIKKQFAPNNTLLKPFFGYYIPFETSFLRRDSMLNQMNSKLFSLLDIKDKNKRKSFASEYKQKRTDEIEYEYYKFTVMRNPYEFIVSHYFSSKREADFKDYLLANPEHLLTNWNIISNDKNEVLVDHIIKYEEYEKGLEIISNKLI